MRIGPAVLAASAVRTMTPASHRLSLLQHQEVVVWGGREKGGGRERGESWGGGGGAEIERKGRGWGKDRKTEREAERETRTCTHT